MALCAVHACVVASLMIAGNANPDAEERPKVITTDYDNVSPDKLISVFIRSYVGAGFKLRETKRTVTDLGTQDTTRLVFEISNPAHPRKKKGIASFLIVSGRGVKRCSPCSVHAEIFGGLADAPEYDEKEYGDFLAMMIEANRKAQAAIRTALGKSLAHLNALQGGSSDICSSHA
jgi:hypothetical protein